MRFLLPFSLLVTRVHIISGFGLVVLVGLHLLSRTPYFKSILQSAGNENDSRRHITYSMLWGIMGVWLVLLISSLWGGAPAQQIIDLSYESRNRAQIFRSDPQTVYKQLNIGMRLKRATDTDASLLIEIEWGSEFAQKWTGAKQPMDVSRPQIAMWTESKTGTMIETLFLSEQAGYSENFEWGGRLQKRVRILPIWRNRFTLSSGVNPEGEEAAFVSGATPEHSFSIHNYLKTNSEPFYLYIEINAPNDHNDYFNADQSRHKAGFTAPGIGQPSVLYGAYIEPTKDKQYLLLDLIGHGGSSTSEGSIHYDLEQLTSAKQLIEKILVRVKRIPPDEDKQQSE